MFLHLLSEEQQDLFLKLAHLVSISDNPLLWDGRTFAELTGDTDISKVSLQESEHEKTVLESFARECGEYNRGWGRELIETVFSKSDAVWLTLIGKLKPLSLHKQNDPEERIKASVEVLHQLLAGKTGDTSPAAPKIMLYELMLLALADGQITTVEGVLLKQFAAAYKLEYFIHDDLLERAEGINREAGKALAIILE